MRLRLLSLPTAAALVAIGVRQRGTVVRSADLVRRVARSGLPASDELVVELRSIASLSREPALARATDLRIASTASGTVTLLVPSTSSLVGPAREALLELGGVLDVRSVDRSQVGHEPAEGAAEDGAGADEPRAPGSPGVVGAHPNRADEAGGAVAPLDEHPDGHSPHEDVVASRRSP
jgi:hypothetical protein